MRQPNELLVSIQPFVGQPWEKFRNCSLSSVREYLKQDWVTPPEIQLLIIDTDPVFSAQILFNNPTTLWFNNSSMTINMIGEPARTVNPGFVDFDDNILPSSNLTNYILIFENCAGSPYNDNTYKFKIIEDIAANRTAQSNLRVLEIQPLPLADGSIPNPNIYIFPLNFPYKIYSASINKYKNFKITRNSKLTGRIGLAYQPVANAFKPVKLDNLITFDGAKWTDCGYTLPQQVSNGGSALIEREIIYSGGWSSFNNVPDCARAEVFTFNVYTFQSYNLGAILLAPQEAPLGLNYNNDYYSIAGQIKFEPNPLHIVQKLTFLNPDGSWRRDTVAPFKYTPLVEGKNPPTTANNRFISNRTSAAVVYNNYIYFFIGSAVAGENLIVDIYNPAANSGAGATITNAITYNYTYWIQFSGCLVNNKIYLCGGLKDGGASANCVNTVIEFNPASNTFKVMNPLLQKRYNHRAISLYGKIYLVGGIDDIGQPVNIIEEYNPTLNNDNGGSQLITPNPNWVPRANMAVTAYKTKIFGLGGNPLPSGGYTAKVQYLQ